jgi:pyruvate kinase
MPGSTDLMKVETIPEILAQGTGVLAKIIQGKVRHISIPLKTADIEIDPDDILVVESSHRSLIPLARRAAALISQEGGMECHAFTLAMELGIPAIVGVNDALSILTDGMEITLDSEHGNIFAGKKLD